MRHDNPVGSDIPPAWIMTATLAVAQRLCRTIAPHDLADVPLYIVRQSEISSEFGTAEGCDGFTTPSLDLHVREALGPRWRGRGPCMVVNDTTLQRDVHPDDLEYVTLGIVLHELGHILVRPQLYAGRAQCSPERLKFESLVIADAVTRQTSSVEVKAYFGHEAGFIRAVLHLRHRAEHAGVRLAPATLCAGRRYGLSHAQRYADALGDEPLRLTDRTIRDILNMNPPPDFTRLWREDVAAYHQCFSHFHRRPE